jgi:NADP-dependent aldehyde dehydrogenase
LGAFVFQPSPVFGAESAFAQGMAVDVGHARLAADAAIADYSASPRATRATFLDQIAYQIEARGAEVTGVGSAKAGLHAARLGGERGRIKGQLRLCASRIRDGAFHDRRVEAARHDRKPAWRPEIRMMQRA